MISTTEPIDLRRSRGFSQQVNVTVEFLRQNYRELGRVLLYIVGPSLLLTGVVLFIASDIQAGILAESSERTTVVWATILLGCVQFFLLYIVFVFDICAMNAYVFLYLRHGADGFGLRDVWREARGGVLAVARILMAAGFLLFGILIVCAVLIDLGGLFSLIFAGLIAFAALYVLVLLNPLMTVRLYEDLYTSDAVKRCSQLVRGHWWLTAGIMVLFQVLVAVPSLLLEGGVTLIIWIGRSDPYWHGGVSFIRMLPMLMGIASVLAIGLTQSMFVLASTLHYFNLLERKEAIRLSERIDSIGAEEERTDRGAVSML